MKKNILLWILLFFGAIHFNAHAELTQDQLDKLSSQILLFQNHYDKSHAWDCSRSPANAVSGDPWYLYSFGKAFDISFGRSPDIPIDWGTNNDRYVQFFLDNANGSITSGIYDDVLNTNSELCVILKLFEADGTFVKTISQYGTIQGIGASAPGLFYTQQGSFGTVLTTANYNIGDEFTYTPEIGMATLLSQIGTIIVSPQKIVTFYSEGTLHEVKTIDEGETVTQPSNPTPPTPSQTFLGWYTEASGGTIFNFSTAINADLNLYAHFSDPTTNWKVTFYNEGEIHETQNVEDGQNAIRPTDPTSADYSLVFDDWYTQASGGIIFDFNSEIKSDTDIFAIYETFDPQLSIEHNFQPFYSCDNTPSAVQSFIVSGEQLIDDITITAPEGYEISTSEKKGYTNEIYLAQTEHEVRNSLFIRLKSNTSGLVNGTLVVTTPNPNGSIEEESVEITGSMGTKPVPVITGSVTPYYGYDITYSTAANQYDYEWQISGGGTIVSGGNGYNEVVVRWNDINNIQSISVTYQTLEGCVPDTPTQIDIEVQKAPLSITVNNQSKYYGDVLVIDENEYVVEGLKFTDAVSSITLESAEALDARATVLGSPYQIVPKDAQGTGLDNYNISYINGALTVIPSTLTITALDGTKLYGDLYEPNLDQVTISGLKNDEQISSVDLLCEGYPEKAGVAGSPYTINVSNAIGTDLSNYAVEYLNGTLEVGRAKLYVYAKTQTITYDQTPDLSVVAEGFKNDENEENAAGYVSPKINNFSRELGESLLIPEGGEADNYYFELVSAILTIEQYATTVTASNGGTVEAEGNFKYGTEVTVTAWPNLGYRFINWTDDEGIASTENTYTYTVDGVRNLVANFEAIVYHITYETEVVELNNGSNLIMEYTIETKANLINGMAAGPFYDFGGWFIDESLELQILNTDELGLQDVTLYSKFTRTLPADTDIRVMLGKHLGVHNSTGSELLENGYYTWYHNDSELAGHKYYVEVGEPIPEGTYVVTIKLDDGMDVVLSRYFANEGTIYPNPVYANGEVTINTGFNSISYYYIIDQTGRIIYESNVNQQNGTLIITAPPYNGRFTVCVVDSEGTSINYKLLVK